MHEPPAHQHTQPLTFEHFDDHHEVFVDEERPGQVAFGPDHGHERLLWRGLLHGPTCQRGGGDGVRDDGAQHEPSRGWWISSTACGRVMNTV